MFGEYPVSDEAEAVAEIRRTGRVFRDWRAFTQQVLDARHRLIAQGSFQPDTAE